MTSIISAYCCCNPSDCPTPDESSTVEIKFHAQWATSYKARQFYCRCECVPCTPITCPPMDFGSICPEPSTCSSSGFIECNCGIFGGLVFGYSHEETRSWYMEEPVIETLPFLSNTTQTGSGMQYWIEPTTRQVTDFQVSNLEYQRWTWESEIDGVMSTEGPPNCCVCKTITRDPGQPTTVSAVFNAWPSYSTGPMLFKLRSSNALIYWWDISGGKFRIKVNSGGAVLWEYTYAGKTLDELRTAILAQTAAPVTFLWASIVATPNAFSRGLLCDICLGPQSGAQIEANSGSYTTIVGFLNSSVVPDPADPDEPKVVALFQSCLTGWNTSVGGEALEYFDRNDCADLPRVTYANYVVMCQGVSFAGAGQLCSSDIDAYILSLPCLSVQDAPGIVGELWGNCDDDGGLYECGYGPSDPLPTCVDDYISLQGGFVCNWKSTPVKGSFVFSHCAQETIENTTFSGVDFADCETGGGCYSARRRRDRANWVLEHRYVRRIS